MSCTIRVPAGVPSLVHNGRSVAPFETRKNSCSSAAVSCCGSPVLKSKRCRKTVPASVPSVSKRPDRLGLDAAR
jgi:hypothetical protein